MRTQQLEFAKPVVHLEQCAQAAQRTIDYGGAGPRNGPYSAAGYTRVMSLLNRIASRSLRLVGVQPAFQAEAYWERRYAAGDDSGAGSDGFNYEFKRDYIRHVIRTYGTRTAVDLGCGDGRQLFEILTTGALDEYQGIDVARSAVERCRELYRDHPKCRFDGYDTVEWKRYDLALSLDVLYHIVDYRDYLAYLRQLFGCSDYVLLYAYRRALPSAVAHMVNRDNFAEIAKLDLPTELIEEQHHPKKSTSFALFRNG